MKKILFAISFAVLLATSCQKPEFIESDANRQGLSSLSAIFTSGKFVDQELTRFSIDSLTYADGYFCIPIPWYYPVTSDDQTNFYMSSLRIQAELQPNFKISPRLGILDLNDENWFTLTDPNGNSRRICITGKRVHSSEAELISFMITDMMINAVIYKDSKTIMIPYTDDLSSVSVSGQVSPHAVLSKISGREFKVGAKYDLNEGATVSVLADDKKTETVYNVVQRMPEKIDMGLNPASVVPLFNIDPVTTYGFPPYTQKSYVSLASLENYLVVCFGDGSAPVYMNRFTGQKQGNIVLGSAVADVITNDENENLLIANLALGGGTNSINVYRTASVKEEPEFIGSFINPTDVPLGHRMKVIGDIDEKAVIVFTAEGIDGVTSTAKAVYVKVESGEIVGDPVVVDFASAGLGWGSAPVTNATVVAASVNPENDGWFVDYYGNNSVPEEDTNADCYILHYFDKKGNDKQIDLVGNWACNPNCLDAKNFNNARYMALFVVSHFPCWGTGPRLYLYEITAPDMASRQFEKTDISWTQIGDYDGINGASGDVVLCPTSDGYRMYVYYYDHHSHAIGGFVADCIKI